VSDVLSTIWLDKYYKKTKGYIQAHKGEEKSSALEI
jgi:hypothetical protein